MCVITVVHIEWRHSDFHSASVHSVRLTYCSVLRTLSCCTSRRRCSSWSWWNSNTVNLRDHTTVTHCDSHGAKARRTAVGRWRLPGGCLLALQSSGSELARCSLEQRDREDAALAVLVQLPGDGTQGVAVGQSIEGSEVKKTEYGGTGRVRRGVKVSLEVTF